MDKNIKPAEMILSRLKKPTDRGFIAQVGLQSRRSHTVLSQFRYGINSFGLRRVIVDHEVVTALGQRRSDLPANAFLAAASNKSDTRLGHDRFQFSVFGFPYSVYYYHRAASLAFVGWAERSETHSTKLAGRVVIVKSLYLSLYILVLVPPLHAEEAFPLRDGDRVVFIGSTLIEREQRYGYWETALTRRYPDKSITFRNLGWSGDTVFGDARAGFGTQADGFRHLKDHALALKPTVIIIGYGTNESFDGPKGLPRFVKGLETLLDTFAPTKARIVLLSPLKQENLGHPLPDPTQNNKNLRLYSDAIRDVAEKRGHRFVDLYNLVDKEKYNLTEDGIHLTAWGYWRTAPTLELMLGLPFENWPRECTLEKSFDAKARTQQQDEAVRLKLVRLQISPPPMEGAPASYRWEDEQSNRWRRPYAKASGGERVFLGPDLAQTEKLRQAIIAKNRLYFYRWRPENETYLFGFRKHEQGQNAREIPRFDPLIAEKEREIARLRVPVAHTYELKAEKKP